MHIPHVCPSAISRVMKSNRVMFQSPLERIPGHELTLRPTLFVHSVIISEGLLISSSVLLEKEAMALGADGTAAEASSQGEERLRVPQLRSSKRNGPQHSRS